MRFHEYVHWSVILGCNAVRLSVFNGQGAEFFMLLERDGKINGKGWRDRRRDALDAIEEAIEIGCEPGEVRVIA